MFKQKEAHTNQNPDMKELRGISTRNCLGDNHSGTELV